MEGARVEILTFVLTPFAENTYLLVEDGEALLIDPGEPAPELLDALKQYRVPTICLTHAHIDHIGGVAECKRATGAELICHKDAAPMLLTAAQQGMMFGMRVEAAPPPDRLINEGDTVKVGEVALKVVNVPGHAPGHIALIGDGFVIGGDVLFQGSIGRTDLPGGSYETLINSIKTRLLTLDDGTVVYSGHGPPTTIGMERRINPFLVDA